jgi:LemA protein
MDTTQIGIGIGVAVLLFWTVGAYNRLVRLRNAILRGFAPVDAQYLVRQGELQALCAAHAPAEGVAPEPWLEALQAACRQTDAAHARARTYPGAAAATASLRLAEDILSDTRSRMPAEATAHTALGDIGTRLAAIDATLAFARRQFNDTVEEYNRAVRQFPTWVIAWLFSFRCAATL